MFYISYKCQESKVDHIFVQFIKNLFLNAELYSGEGNKLKYSWKFIGIYFEDSKSIVNLNEKMFILGIEITDEISKEEIDRIVLSGMKYWSEIPTTTCTELYVPEKDKFKIIE